MLTFTLAISCLTTSNLPWFMDLTFQVPMQYCSASDLASITSDIPNWVLILLWLHQFILSEVSSLVISSSILGTYWPGEFIFQCPIFLPLHTVHEFLKARIWKWFSIPFSSGPHLAELSTITRSSWLALHSMAHSFLELDKTVVHVIRLVNFLWLWFLSLCPLMPSLSAYPLTGVSLTL